MLAHYHCQRFFIELRLIIAIMVECVKSKGKRKDKARKIEKRKDKRKIKGIGKREKGIGNREEGRGKREEDREMRR